MAALDVGHGEFGALALRAGLLPREDGVRELLAARPSRMSLPELRRYLTVPGGAGVEILSGIRERIEGDEPLPRPDEIDRSLYLLEQWYPVVVMDTAPTWTEPIGAVALAHADSLVLTVQAAGVDERALERAVTAVVDRGSARLAGAAVLAVVETSGARQSYAARRRIEAVRREMHAVVRIPYDPALSDASVRWGRLRRRTRAAFAALVDAVESTGG